MPDYSGIDPDYMSDKFFADLADTNRTPMPMLNYICSACRENDHLACIHAVGDSCDCKCVAEYAVVKPIHPTGDHNAS